jgi:hypothetical protein
MRNLVMLGTVKFVDSRRGTAGSVVKEDRSDSAASQVSRRFEGRRGRWLLLSCAFALAASLSSPRAHGQAVNGSILGTVTDTSKAVAPSATVTVTNQGTGVSRSVTTNGSGYYSVPDLSPGTYRERVEKTGFAVISRVGITLLVNSTVRVDVTLQPGKVTQTVSVQSRVPILQTETAQTGGTLTAVQAAQLPLGTNYNFQSLVNLIPGAVNNNGSASDHSTFFNAQQTLNSPVNGFSSLTDNYQIEGVNDNERTGLLQVYVPPVQAIQEVDVTTSDYDAEQGTALGAVVNVILKSGTNQFHGSAYEIYNGQALNARSFFELGPQGTPFVNPRLVSNYWGAQFGGPIRKDKTFFFVDFLRTSNNEGQFQTLTVPTVAERNGDFSDPVLDQIYNPQTGDEADCLLGGNASLCGTGRTGFPGNIIPSASINPISDKILALVPAPNNNLNAAGTGKYVNNYLETSDFYKDTPLFDVKVDQYQSQRDHIGGRLSFEEPVTYQAPAYGQAGGPIGGGFEGTGTDKTYSSDIMWDHVFSPTLIVQNRVGLNRYRNSAQETDYGSDASTAIGIPGVNISPFESGLTGVFINSTTSDPLVGYSASLPWIRAETDFDFVSNWNKIIGNHTLKWGGNVIRIRDDLFQDQTFSVRGAWDFEPGETSTPGASENFANNFASFLLDSPNEVGRDLSNLFPAYRATQLFLYANDKWQVDPKLTLNLGLRWEFYPPATPHFAGGFSNYDPATNDLVLAGVGTNPLNLGMQERYHDFAPRLGLAYRLTRKDVVRAGFGISYEPFEDNEYAYNYPVRGNNAFTALSGYGPALYSNGTPVTFEQGFPATPFVTIPSNGILPANTPALISQEYYVMNLHYKDPYVQSWNFAYEHALPGELTLDVAYVGNRGVHVPVQYNLNAVTNPADIGLNTAGQPEYVEFGRTAETDMYFAGMSSDYNSLQVELNKHLSNGLSITTSYTYGKTLGYAEENGDNSSSLTYYIDEQRNYAPTDFDHTHIFALSYVWNLPFGAGHSLLKSGVASRLLGGWQTSGVVSFMTGATMNVSCTDTCAPLDTPGNGQSPWQVGPVTTLYGVNTQPWFTTGSFADPTKLFGKPTFGDVGMYSMFGPNFFEWDASLFRTFKLSERFDLQLRTDWFSATNTPEFANPGTTFESANFGYITSTNGGNRTIDVGAKLTF